MQVNPTPVQPFYAMQVYPRKPPGAISLSQKKSARLNTATLNEVDYSYRKVEKSVREKQGRVNARRKQVVSDSVFLCHAMTMLQYRLSPAVTSYTAILISGTQVRS